MARVYVSKYHSFYLCQISLQIMLLPILIILVIKQIGLPLRGRPILLITRMITDRIGLHSEGCSGLSSADQGETKLTRKEGVNSAPYTTITIDL